MHSAERTRRGSGRGRGGGRRHRRRAAQLRARSWRQPYRPGPGWRIRPVLLESLACRGRTRGRADRVDRRGRRGAWWRCVRHRPAGRGGDDDDVVGRYRGAHSSPLGSRRRRHRSVAATEVEQVPADDPVEGHALGSPLDDLPPGVTRPHRTSASDRTGRPTAKHIVFLDGSPLGDVWTVEVDTGKTRKLTGGFEHRGFSRAYYLSNGDLLLCGPTSGPKPTPDRPEAGRFTGVMSVLRAPFRRAARATRHRRAGRGWRRRARRCRSRGTARTSTTRTRTSSIASSTGSPRSGRARSVTSTVAPRSSTPARRSTVTRSGCSRCSRCRSFRPPDDRELIFTAYAYPGRRGLRVRPRDRRGAQLLEQQRVRGGRGSRRRTVMPRTSSATWSTPASIPARSTSGGSRLEDGTWERVTEFNRWAPYYASNPAVSPDGDRLAFQLSIDGDTEGQGAGILLMNLEPGAEPSHRAAGRSRAGCPRCRGTRPPARRRTLRRVVALDLRDAVHRLHARQVVLLERHAAAPSARRPTGLEVVDRPPHLRVGTGRSARGREEREVTGPRRRSGGRRRAPRPARDRASRSRSAGPARDPAPEAASPPNRRGERPPGAGHGCLLECGGWVRHSDRGDAETHRRPNR